jgi:DNA polymerase III epsilon subunit
MTKSLDEVEFIIFDTETTGLEPESGDRVVEIAAIKFKGRQKQDSFQALVNPKRQISEGAFRVNKISQEMLLGAPTIDLVLPDFLAFIQGSCLCSYNAGFDLKFLENELNLTGMGRLKDVPVADILSMARRLLPGLERYALWFVAESLGIKAQQAHRAFSDVELSFEVFHKLKDILQAKGIVDFASFMHLFGMNSGQPQSIHNDKIAQIRKAIDLGAKLKIRYISSLNAEVTEREVIPKEIKDERNNVYLVGFCSLRRQERTFRIDGILHIEIA